MTVDPPSEEQRVRVWEEMIAANMRSMYFARLAARERRTQKGAAALAAALSAGACTIILSGAAVDLWLLWLTVPAAVLSGVSGLGKYGESATKFVNCSVAWADLHQGLQSTWVDIESGDRHLEGANHELGRERRIHGPADDSPTEHVKDDGQIEEAR